MAISYHIYANDGRGGDVDDSSPIATTNGLTLTVGPLAAPSDNTFAVRAFDAASGIEEANTDARVRIVIDPDGLDVTSRPSGVIGLAARRTAGGTCRVSWSYDEAGQGGPPSLFAVRLTPGPAGPAATVAYQPGVSGYGCSLSGLANPGTYTIEVRAIGSSSLLAGIASSVAIDYQPSPLGLVGSLAASPTP